ncbi:hypothetical protein NEOLI_005513 [Neolecta irregularis DAH-3]|uniref:Uncharacterized protein n=1 Tax=Neolecta irregularis (strain DAH-3) TaxID=1198029 RepID=A0A1U7LL34_NEOID|nr:hypothetical protein NEOLI_005513 [Neolecta irregularis DAH-3]|eukprot:OLL23252.1 hypothetical protein NEOLI_005513 [Neolecta irregularis DAH-3]
MSIGANLVSGLITAPHLETTSSTAFLTDWTRPTKPLVWSVWTAGFLGLVCLNRP